MGGGLVRASGPRGLCQQIHQQQAGEGAARTTRSARAPEVRVIAHAVWQRHVQPAALLAGGEILFRVEAHRQRALDSRQAGCCAVSLMQTSM